MGCCLRKQVSKPPELFRHTSLIDEENNFYIDHNERLHTLLELDEVMYNVLPVFLIIRFMFILGWKCYYYAIWGDLKIEKENWKGSLEDVKKILL